MFVMMMLIEETTRRSILDSVCTTKLSQRALQETLERPELERLGLKALDKLGLNIVTP